MMRFLPPALVALLCAPAVASAAPFGELPFVPLGAGPATCVHAAGAGRVALLSSPGEGPETVVLFRVPAGGAPVPDGAVPLGATAGCPRVAVAASGAAAVAGPRSDLARGPLIVAIREPGGALTRVPLPRLRIGVLFDLDVAIAPSGAAVVSWSASRGGAGADLANARLQAMRRPPGGAFGAPQTLATRLDPFNTDVELGIDDAGRATVAWHGGISSRANVATAAPGAAFGKPQRLTPVAHELEPLALAVAPDGGALLAYKELADENGPIRVFERSPGAARMSPGASFPPVRSRPFLDRPLVALAPGGGALVAWRGDGLRDASASLELALRPPGGAFGPRQTVGPGTPGISGWATSVPPPAFVPGEGSMSAAIGADGSVVLGWTEEEVIAGGHAPALVAVAAGTLTGTWEGAALLGGPGRSADGLAVLASPAAVLWADNLVETDFGFEDPFRGGRLHGALPGVAGHDPEPPPITLSARSQRIRSDEPVFVRARCEAACDLRAVAGRAPGTGTPAAIGAAQLDAAGSARIALNPSTGVEDLVPRGGGPLRVTVHATAPGGRRATLERLDVRVRHAFVPRPRAPRDVRVTRRGRRLVVTWRTARPARSQEFVVEALRRRGDPAALDATDLAGRGRTRFRAVLRGARRARWVRIEWSSFESRLGGGSTYVRVPGAP